MPDFKLTEHRITVLLVDDQPIVGEAVREMFAAEQDIDFHYCPDPTQAIKTANRICPTVILLDLVMPQIDGLALVRYFRANKATREVPLIVLSSKEDAQIKAESFTLGANDYMVKLPDRLEVLARVRYHSRGYINLLERNEAYAALLQSMESELKIAGKIQKSFLPKAFPLLRGKSLVDISARLEPARQVGGDLYDYFLLDEDHLFFTVGDVSDKGIPAALFMAVTKTLLKGIAEKRLSPSEILRKCNIGLCMGNDSMMFVTLFCGILDLRSGLLRYSNAGHEHPFLVRKDARPEELRVPEGIFLGVDEEASYKTMEIVLEAGDRLIVYTDGVTEALNSAGQFYSHQNLVAELESSGSLRAEEIANKIVEAVNAFASGVAQADDITLLALSLTDEIP
ncbi:MAG: PP2C family protein-serine/threonine phosphatase [Syntrophobacteraceae bacterium]